MKSLFYYLFGLFTTIIVFILFFNNYADLYLDDYYVELLYNTYKKDWFWMNISITTIWIMFVLIFVYSLGKETNHEKKEKLLIENKETNE